MYKRQELQSRASQALKAEYTGMTDLYSRAEELRQHATYLYQAYHLTQKEISEPIAIRRSKTMALSGGYSKEIKIPANTLPLDANMPVSYTHLCRPPNDDEDYTYTIPAVRKVAFRNC